MVLNCSMCEFVIMFYYHASFFTFIQLNVLSYSISLVNREDYHTMF